MSLVAKNTFVGNFLCHIPVFLILLAVAPYFAHMWPIYRPWLASSYWWPGTDDFPRDRALFSQPSKTERLDCRRWTFVSSLADLILNCNLCRQCFCRVGIVSSTKHPDLIGIGSGPDPFRTNRRFQKRCLNNLPECRNC